ncbi:MAG: DUF1830 domain-containing protein [Spirulina sp. SIO3F2]|nr:DUF1830 domain-containing protein [Spirulina sp. SIO3F2]
MTQILDALPTDHPDKILCHYRNPTVQLQIIRITNIPHWYFERVVFASDVVIFEAVARAILEIHGSDGITTVLTDHIPCETLQL